MGIDLFYENEKKANIYSAKCLTVAAVVIAVTWFLNIIGVFIVDQTLMNIAMPIGILFLLIPVFMVKVLHKEGTWVKYMLIVCFILGITVLASSLTIQVIMAWACPIIMSCHYYSPKFTRRTTYTVLLFMFVSTYVGLYFGVWDANMMRSAEVLNGFQHRQEHIIVQMEQGDNLLLRVFVFYYSARAAICYITYLICKSLSERTHNLVEEQHKTSMEKQRVDTELSMATQIQKNSLPNIFPAYPTRSEFDIYATMTPSKEVGGDFYDFFFIDKDHLALVIADVSGKGVPAAMFMMVVKTILKNLSQADMDPATILKQANDQLCENEENEMFVTVWLGIYEISTGKLTSANAGHEDMILKSENNGYEIIKTKHGFVLAGMEGMRYKNHTIQLEVGEQIFVYTDGIPEAIDSKEAAYGLDRLLQVMNASEHTELSGLLQNIKNDIDVFAEGTPQFDDITMLILERCK